jgi:cysteine-rich repeat protein
LETCGLSYRENINSITGFAVCTPITCDIPNCSKNGCEHEVNFCNRCVEKYYDPIDLIFKPIIQDEENGVCVSCLDIPDRFNLHEDGSCSNKCGNGYLYELGSHDSSECDDGNIINGDGCSSECIVEDNWVCKRGDQSTPKNEKPYKSNADRCDPLLTYQFKINTEISTGNPKLDMSFNDDVCITPEIFFKIYEPYCMKVDERTGKGVSILEFEIEEITLCKKYLIEYVLKDNYSGELGFRYTSREIHNREVRRVENYIYDAKDNIVDFTKFHTRIYFDNSELEAKKKLEALMKKVERLQRLFAGPIFFAIMAIGPLAEFVANVLQKLIFLQTLNIQVPFKVSMFISIAADLGKTPSPIDETQGGDDLDAGIYASSFDKMLNITISDSAVPSKFADQKMSRLFIKNGASPCFSLIIVYLVTVGVMYLERKFKFFDQMTQTGTGVGYHDEYALESEKAKFRR